MDIQKLHNKVMIYQSIIIASILLSTSTVYGRTTDNRCKMDKEKIALAKEVFGKYHEILMNNLSVSSNYKDHELCVIYGQASHSIGGDAILVFGKNEVYGAIYTDGDEVILTTKTLDKGGIVKKWIAEHETFIYPMIPYIIDEEPRYGKVEIAKDNDGNNVICNVKIADKTLKSFTGDHSLSLQKFYRLDNEDVYLIFNNSGGTACPGVFRIISVNKNESIFESEEFGTCNDEFTDKKIGDLIEIKIRGTDEDVVAKYGNGKLSINNIKISSVEKDERFWLNK